MSRDAWRTVGHHPRVDITLASGPAASPPATIRRRALVLCGPALVGFVAVTHVAALALDGFGPFARYVDRFMLFALIGAFGFGAFGSLAARVQPENAIAPIAAAIGWGFGICAGFDVLGTGLTDTAPEVATWLVWVAQWVWPPAMFAVPTLLTLRFPNGALPDRRLWALEAVAVVGIGLAALQFATAPYGTLDLAPLAEVSNPLAAPVVSRVAGAGVVLVGLSVVGSLAVLLRRMARASGAERAQLQWVLLGIAGAVTIVVASVLIGPDAAVLSSIGIVLVPGSMAIAVLRHRLWDVEVVIDRSLTYGLVSIAILVLYAVTVELLDGLLGRTTAGPLIATGLVAAAVLPLRERAQRFVTQLRYGDRGDPHAVLDRLGTQLAASGDRAVLLDDVTAAIVRALRLGGATIVVDDVVVASAGIAGDTPIDIPLTVRGEPEGSLRVTQREGDALSGADRRLLETLARHVAQTVRAERLHEQLQTSRAKLVTAREEERRRIRRDLHDELGPTLSAAALAVEQIAVELGPLPESQAARLQDTAEGLRGTVGTVRSLVAGLRPATLDELGLRGALHELVRRLQDGPAAVHLDIADDLPELPAAADAAIYRIVAEAITNVTRHADARHCHVTVTAAPTTVEVVVHDDGRGLPTDLRPGVGLASMRRRAEELGGTFTAASPKTGGTTIVARLPTAS